MTPSSGSPGSRRSAISVATESETRRGTTPLGARLRSCVNVSASARTVPALQYAGTATVISAEGPTPPASWARAPKASTRRRSARWAEPSTATKGTGSPTRSTKPLITTPASGAMEISPGKPRVGGRRSWSVSTARRRTGCAPIRAATRFVAPIDNPIGPATQPLYRRAALIALIDTPYSVREQGSARVQFASTVGVFTRRSVATTGGARIGTSPRG